MKSFKFDTNDERNYIFLVPIGKEETFINFIRGISKKDRIKILHAKKNCSFRIYFLHLPENFQEIENKLYELQNELLRSRK